MKAGFESYSGLFNYRFMNKSIKAQTVSYFLRQWVKIWLQDLHFSLINHCQVLP